LPAKVSQQVLMQVCRDWKSWQEAREEYAINPAKFKAKPRIPGYKDKLYGRNVLVYTVQAISKKAIKKSIIKFSKTQLKIRTKKREINQVRIVPNQGYIVVEVIYEKEIEKKLLDRNRIAGIDIGVGNLAAVTSNVIGFKPLLINGKPLKSVNSYYNKERSRLQSSLEENRFLSNKLDKLTLKRNSKIESYLHQASRIIIDTLVQCEIGTLVIGKNNEWKQSINLGKANNQNFTFIPHAKFISMLKYKAELVGIKVIVLEESYTSKCSFLDSEPIQKQEVYQGKRIKRGLFRSSHNILINADINASANIIRKAFPNAFADGIEAVVVRPSRVNLKGLLSPRKSTSHNIAHTVQKSGFIGSCNTCL
jgi:IS605 OrfB family transposase